LSSAQRKELGVRIEATPWQWVGQEPAAVLVGAHRLLPGRAVVGQRRMRLFTVSQRSGYAPMIGGLGYLLAPATPPIG
jgi:uncharacterized circularly permuted ATP-grasp superfamily protein